MHTEFGLSIKTPRVVSHVAHGVSERDKQKSRFNLYNAALACWEIKKVLQSTPFQSKDICIGTSYRAQASVYRKAISLASEVPKRKDLNLVDIQVKTVDTLQGGEAGLIIL